MTIIWRILLPIISRRGFVEILMGISDAGGIPEVPMTDKVL